MKKETLPFSITRRNGRPIPHCELWYRTFRYTQTRRRNGAFSLGGGLEWLARPAADVEVVSRSREFRRDVVCASASRVYDKAPTPP